MKSRVLVLAATFACTDPTALDHHPSELMAGSALQPPPPVGGGGAAGACNIAHDPQLGTIASSPSPAAVNIPAGMGQWVAMNCGAGFMATPRDVTCTFQTKLEDPTAGNQAKVRHHDWSQPQNDHYHRVTGGKREYFDQAGKLLDTDTIGRARAPTENGLEELYHCYLDCTGKLSSTLGTAEFIGASAVGIPPGFLPPQAEIPMGRSFCQEFQARLRGAGADCSLGDVRNTWEIAFARDQKTPWTNTGEVGADTYDRGPGITEKMKYPTATKVVVSYTYEIWALDRAAMQTSCNLKLAAIPQANRDASCRTAVPISTFSSIIAAAICIKPEPPPGPGMGSGSGTSVYVPPASSLSRSPSPTAPPAPMPAPTTSPAPSPH